MTLYFRIECVDQTARVLISVTELIRNDFQQKRLEGDLQHPSCQLRSAFRFGAYWWIRCAFCVFQFDFHPLLDSDPCK